jgi:hypothetical protein
MLRVQGEYDQQSNLSHSARYWAVWDTKNNGVHFHRLCELDPVRIKLIRDESGDRLTLEEMAFCAINWFDVENALKWLRLYTKIEMRV